MPDLLIFAPESVLVYRIHAKQEKCSFCSGLTMTALYGALFFISIIVIVTPHLSNTNLGTR